MRTMTGLLTSQMSSISLKSFRRIEIAGSR